MGEFEMGKTVDYQINVPGNGVYFFIIDGCVKINNHTLNKRDALGVYNTNSIPFETEAKSRLLIIETPML